MAIIAILAAVLLPVLSQARERARRAQCLSNLKQWGTALQIYSTDNNNAMPCDGMSAAVMPDGSQIQGGGDYCGGTEPPSGTPQDPYAWFNALPPSVAEQSLLNYYNQEILGHGLSSSGRSIKYMPFPGSKGPIWECPSASMTQATVANILASCDNPPPSYPGPGGAGFFSYAMNIDLKRKGDGSSTWAWPTMPKLTVLRNPSSTVCMFDIVFDPVTEKVNDSPQYNSVNPAGRQNSFAGRHSQGGNINFMDGHAAYFKDSSVTNGNHLTSVPFSGEPLNPEVVWNAAGRGQEFGQ